MASGDASLNPTADNGGEALLVVAWVLMALSLVVVGLRTWTRLGYLKGRLTASDCFMIAAALLQVGQSIMLTISVSLGLGHHYLTIPKSHVDKTVYTGMMSEPFGCFGPMFGRISCALFLISTILPQPSKKRLILVVVLIFNVLVNIYVIVEILAQCGTHVEAVWDFALAPKYCLSPNVETYSSYVQVSICALTDLILSVLPFVVLRKLQMAKRDRIAVSAILGLSIFAFLAAIVRSTQSQKLANANDFTWYFPDFMICVVIENNIVIICGSMFALVPLWKRVGGSLSSIRASRNSRRNTLPDEVQLDDHTDRSKGSVSKASASGDASNEKPRQPPPPPQSHLQTVISFEKQFASASVRESPKAREEVVSRESNTSSEEYSGDTDSYLKTRPETSREAV